MAAHNEFGIEGEDKAANYLIREGYTILDRNWKSGHKELDIVAEKDGILVVVEVKTRTSSKYGNPEDAVTPKKIRNTVLAADAYIRFNRIDLPVRFDIISVLSSSGDVINHIEDAFRSPVWYR
ncbi:MAG: YraN family protein [Bacteroidaceae bacterium]|nr:YraN family protein [Bacteroidaceae bacterium]